MMTPLVWRFLAALGIIIVLLVGYAKFTLEQPSGWQNTTGLGLQNKVQSGLRQMYWQWQQEGRAAHIIYQPENVNWLVKVNMDARGLPILAANKQGCRDFISWFLEDHLLDSKLFLNTMFISQIEEKPSENETSDTAEPVITSHIRAGFNEGQLFTCKFELNDQIYIYHPDTGDFTFLMGANDV